MPDLTLLDNDVVLKTCCYGLAPQALRCLLDRGSTVAALGIARFVLPKKAARSTNISDKARAIAALKEVFALISFEEPNEVELELAAELEDLAQAQGVDLETGESQLVAMVVHRCATMLLTGDKRAIVAVEAIAPRAGLTESLRSRVACLEQLIRSLLYRLGLDVLRASICKEANADKALAICFSCSTDTCAEREVVEGLASYILDLRRCAPTVMLGADDLSGIVA
jgi:predicted nucleic acid-binding protein